MPAFSVPLSELAATLKMDTIYAPKELSDIPIYTADVNRPGIMLAGYYQYFDASRIQICGMVEISYLKELPEADRRRHLEKMLSLKPPAVIISRGLEVLPEFRYRLKVKAGLTGLAQILGKYNTTPKDKLIMDLMYIEQFSILKDIQLIFQTFIVLLKSDSTEAFKEGQAVHQYIFHPAVQDKEE